MDLYNIKTGYRTKEELKETNDTLYKQEFKSGLSLFNDHNGFIKGELHTFIGAKGTGKSTWSKTILCDLAYQEKGVLLYISEEKEDKYLNSINKAFRATRSTEEEIKKYLDNIIVLGELDQNISTAKVFFEAMHELVTTCELDIIILDNFTTSFLSELPIDKQSAILRGLKNLADKLNIPIVIFFHTSKAYDNAKLDGDSVRGSGTAVNIASYNYLMAQYRSPSGLRNFVFTEKARYHDKSNKTMYEVFYDSRVGMFTKSEKIELETYAQIVSGKLLGKGDFK